MAIGWATANNIVTGFGDGTFKPDAPVTREQLAAML
ncbi:MAG: S-layer homology domain-containing protein [Clostridia bacterium]|nr:S-layer homology domain-containing protein [Clostridia bacterium]